MASLQQQPTKPPPPPTKEEADVTHSLAQDRPTIDAAVKSFISLVCARTLTASVTDESQTTELLSEQQSTLIGLIPNKTEVGNLQQQVLQVARPILQSMNAFTFPIHCTVANSMSGKPGLSKEKKKELLELSIASQLWNGLVSSNQKPSRYLGRRALKHAWKNNLKEDIEAKVHISQQGTKHSEEQVQRQKEWLLEFETLLFHTKPVGPSAPEVEDDSALLWDADGGQNELNKRKLRRQAAATKRGAVTPS
jgi:hypothetical protein